jgi:hypothetical protein
VASLTHAVDQIISETNKLIDARILERRMLPDAPLTAEASRLFMRIQPRISARLQEVNRVPVSVLLWGPAVDSSNPLAPIRPKVRSELRQMGHACFLSEEIYDPHSHLSLRTQQLAQAQEFDLIASIPCTPGAIAEVHDFASDKRIRGKLLVFLNREHLSGYGAQSLQVLDVPREVRIEYYPSETDAAIIEQVILENVQRMREIKYILRGL